MDKYLIGDKTMAKIDEIKAKLASELKVETLDESRELKSFELDSLDLVELLLKLEEQYGVHFEDEDVAKIVTIKDLLDNIQKQL